MNIANERLLFTSIFGVDPDPRIHASDSWIWIRIRIRILYPAQHNHRGRCRDERWKLRLWAEVEAKGESGNEM
jgi:hypothetical protein